MNNKKKAFIILVISAITVAIILIAIKPKNDVKVSDTINNYDYKLLTSATEYQKELFSQLKQNIDNEEEYAKLIGKLFLADFYTLETKKSKVDVGGVDYIYTPYKESFMELAVNSVYKNIASSKIKELPIVTEVLVDDLKQAEYTYDGELKDLQAYTITYSISYKKDLGYQKNVIMIIIRNNNKLEIVELKETEQ